MLQFVLQTLQGLGILFFVMGWMFVASLAWGIKRSLGRR